MNVTTFKTLVLREYWENKSLSRTPVIISCVILFALIVGMFTAQSFIFSMGDNQLFLDKGLSEISDANLSELSQAITGFQYGVFLAPLTIGLIFVLFFYSLGSLYNDRRDRSILFWKSMPVSDFQTVMSKVFSAFVVAPSLTAAVAVVAQVVGLVLLTIMVWINGGSAWNIVWSQSSLFTVIFNDFMALFLLALWMAPILGWLWLVSAYAKKGAFLIAVFVPLGVMLVEGLMLGSAHFGTIIGEHFAQLEYLGESMVEKGHPFGVFSSTGFWIGLVISAACIALSVYIRRYRDDSY
ncbi:hypothetical protein [Pleionea litopenaei]|uniref:ABC-2 type transport system permease protein n=1 Tax=Pleionea litopenaei TaxID=3070815 RepID=A0AA51RU56_9GAMM|nr:hypothetical protein [Pleionea sp. HL-JVS1]WMS87756.1 hypothetical protein Q9312_02245 [Pleionea sp. HL-JVS1]